MTGHPRSSWRLLFLAVVTTTVCATVAAQGATTLIDFEIEDQFKKKHTQDDFAGYVVLLVGGGREGSKHTGPWASAILARLKPSPRYRDLRILRYADTRGVPFFLKGMVRGRFPEDPELWTLIDWKGRLAKTYELDPDLATLLLFGRDGRLIARAAGTEPDADALARFVEIARQSLEEPGPE